MSGAREGKGARVMEVALADAGRLAAAAGERARHASGCNRSDRAEHNMGDAMHGRIDTIQTIKDKKGARKLKYTWHRWCVRKHLACLVNDTS